MKQIYKKNLGQHFLYDKKIADSIVIGSKLDPKIPILEIGPGNGILTQAIINIVKPKRLILVEKDKDLTINLQNITKGFENIDIIFQDFLTFDLFSLDSDKVQIISNLPYNISKKVFIKLWLEINKISSMTLMFQKEFVQKLQPKDSKTNPLSLVAEGYYNLKILQTLKAGSFYPKPKVRSQILHFTPLTSKMIFSKEFFWNSINYLFSHPRKTIKHGIANCLLKLDNNKNYGEKLIKSSKAKNLVARETSDKVINKFGIKGNLRPEEIKLCEYVQILNYLSCEIEK